MASPPNQELAKKVWDHLLLPRLVHITNYGIYALSLNFYPGMYIIELGNEIKGFGGGEGIQGRGEEIQREGVEKGVKKRKEGGKEKRRKKEEKRGRKERGREKSQIVGP